MHGSHLARIHRPQQTLTSKFLESARQCADSHSLGPRATAQLPMSSLLKKPERACYGKPYYTALPSPRDPKPQFVSTPLRISAACHRGHVPRIDNAAPRAHIVFLVSFPTIQTHRQYLWPSILGCEKEHVFPSKIKLPRKAFQKLRSLDPSQTFQRGFEVHPGTLHSPDFGKTLGILICSHELRDST